MGAWQREWVEGNRSNALPLDALAATRARNCRAKAYATANLRAEENGCTSVTIICSCDDVHLYHHGRRFMTSFQGYNSALTDTEINCIYLGVSA